MKNYKVIFCALCILAYVNPSYVLAAEKFQVQGEAALRKIVERASPSEMNNDKLSPFLGKWDYAVAPWTGADEEPQKAWGTITNEMVLGDRFLASTVEGNINVDGHESLLKAQGLIGYDTAKKTFTSVWTDTLSTGMMIGTGNYDEEDKAIKESGRFTNPFNGLEEKFRSETKFVDAGNYERTIFTTGKSGKETKLIQFQYTKNKPVETQP